MNPEPPFKSEPGPLSFRRYGCLVVLAVLAVLIIGGVLLVRHLVVGTAVPFKVVAKVIEKANPNVQFTGISGNISTGPSVQSITWGTAPEKRSEILDLRVKYNGYADAQKTKRIIISDVGVRKAHIDLADFGPMAVSRSGSPFASSPASPPSTASPPQPTDLFGMDSIEIQRVLIEDVLVTNRNSDFRLSIPKVSWTGFKATKDSVEAGELEVDSDRLALRTGPGRTLPMGNEKVTFQKSLTGSMQPLLHPAILQPVSFTVDYTFVPGVSKPAFHFTAANGQVEMATSGDGGHALHIRNLDLDAYLDARKLYGPEAAELPQALNVEAVAAPEGGPLKFVSGSFRLGVATFQIEASEVAADAGADDAELRAVWRSEDGDIRWVLPLKDWPFECRPTFRTETKMTPEEILARVFAGKKYTALTAEEKIAIDRRIPIYFTTANP